MVALEQEEQVDLAAAAAALVVLRLHQLDLEDQAAAVVDQVQVMLAVLVQAVLMETQELVAILALMVVVAMSALQIWDKQDLQQLHQTLLEW